MRRHIATLILVSVLAGSAACAGRLRIYDTSHRDYHRWDGREDRAYRVYLTEQHREYREFRTLDQREQDAYWQWRHGHPDRR